MPKITEKAGETEVASALVVRMADRMHKLGKVQREHYAAKARARVEKGSKRAADLAIVRAMEGPSSS
jgi:hypothetical protein